MKIHSRFTLFLRKMSGGKKVVYYYAYNENDKRVGPWSTGERTLTAAKNKCADLYREGKLIPCKTKPVTFGEFAAGFWETGSSYLENKSGRVSLTPSYIYSANRNLTNQILPFFGKMPIEHITSKDINAWLLSFKNRDMKISRKSETKGLKNSYANTALGTFNTMMAWAVEQDIIKVNPCAGVKRLKIERRKIEIFTVEEIQKLFPENWQSVWGDNELAYAANRLASLTGMRIGEIMGLRGEYVFDDYLYVCGNYGDFGYGPTKTKETRNVPVMPEMINLLQKLSARNGGGYVFSMDGGAKPVGRNYLHAEFYRALEQIGIGPEEVARRGLTFHGWRHFLNTELMRQGLTIQQVQAVTGHKSVRMTEWYSHLDARKFTNVVAAQLLISGADQPDGTAEGENTGRRKMAASAPAGAWKPERSYPAQETTENRKRA